MRRRRPGPSMAESSMTALVSGCNPPCSTSADDTFNQDRRHGSNFHLAHTVEVHNLCNCLYVIKCNQMNSSYSPYKLKSYLICLNPKPQFVNIAPNKHYISWSTSTGNFVYNSLLKVWSARHPVGISFPNIWEIPQSRAGLD